MSQIAHSRLDPSITQHGSSYSGTYNVHGGSIHLGNIINIGSKTSDRCLTDLRITDPGHDKDRIQRVQRTKDGVLVECWALSNADFREWRDNKDQRLLWVKGNPGKGKTILLCGIIDELEKAPAEGTALAYFFCQATDDRLSTATAVLRGLVFMLLSRDASLMPHVQARYDIAGKSLFEDINAWQALCEIFTDILRDQKLQKVYLVVDALDECVQDLPQLLDLIISTSQSTRAQWLISSRNEPEIERPLHNIAHWLSLEVNARAVASAVDTYITLKVNDLAQRNFYDEQTKKEVRQHLMSKADNTFLWVTLVCQELSAEPSWNAVEIVKSSPPGLNDLYQRMFDKMYKLRDVTRYHNILALVATAYRPLTVPESSSLVQEDQGPMYNVQFFQQMIVYCGSFLTVRENTVYFVHQSAKDFLVETSSITSTIFPEGQAAVHGHIFSKSIETMWQVLKRDIYGLRDLGFPIEEVPYRVPKPDPLASRRYSCVHWADHLIDSSKAIGRDQRTQRGKRMYKFLETRGLYWIESLSLIGSISEGMLAMRRLLQYLQDQPDGLQTRAVVKDAYRLLQAFRPAIESWPLQLYASVLVFSPRRSVLRSLFTHEEPKWILCKTQLPEQWSACEAILEGHTDGVSSAASSKDGRRVVSGSLRSIRLWDAQTGRCETIINGPPAASNSVAFSADGTQIVSASWDPQTLGGQKIRLWNAQTGKCTSIFEGHTSTVHSAVFSMDGQSVVSASGDKTVRLWDAQTGKCTAVLKDHASYVNSANFSVDARRVVSASDDKTVRLWDSQTGQCTAILEDHTACVKSANFSVDGRYVVSASYDSTVRLWDIETGKCAAIFKGHISGVDSAAFSIDGRRVVSGSIDKTVRLWDTHTGKCTAIFEGHTSSVHSTAFSADGRIISASRDGTVRLWDAGIGGREEDIEGHTSHITLLAFSADGRRIISASWDKAIRLWDTQTMKCTAILKGHTNQIVSAVFSTNGRYMVSGSFDMTIRLWDVQSAACIRTLEGHNAAVHSVAFSADEERIISSSYDETTRLWDVQTGTCLLIRRAGHIFPTWYSRVRSAVHTIMDINSGVDAQPRESDAQLPESTLQRSFGLSLDQAWIQEQGNGILWLPPEYRPRHSAVSTTKHGTNLVLGCSTGRVHLFHLSGSSIN